MQKGPSAPKTAIPQLRLIDFMKFEVVSSNPSANMMTIMPRSAKPLIKGFVPSGKMPVLTRSAPIKRKYKTGVSRVLSARTEAIKTDSQTIAS